MNLGKLGEPKKAPAPKGSGDDDDEELEKPK